MSAITNTTVISNFAEINQLDVLHQIYGRLYMPTEVYEEIQEGLEQGHSFYKNIEQLVYPFAESGWLSLTGLTHDQEFKVFNQLPPRLHRGEAACIAIAFHRDWFFLTDDKDARSEAKVRKISLSGTLGCLLAAIKYDHYSVDQANYWLQEMIDKGYYSPVARLEELIT